ncbi:site-specific DNA-methyltransferase [Clostridiaceae bacterium]|nr:site-specific DNA-methyltransferase [Clostridiaceae bacterium]RKI10168.1 site-specific DNA-methyltransferase [bacterium 1XD21-70]
MKTKALFLENVAHLILHDGGRTFRVITETLDGLGYDVHYKVLAASDYGVAQIRKRVYLVCFRKGGYCQPDSYEKAKTVYFQPINIYDKKDYPHPTIKPLNIIKNLIENSSRPGDLVLDPFLGSGTTAAACLELGRAYLGYEINPEYFGIAEKRILDTRATLFKNVQKPE